MLNTAGAVVKTSAFTGYRGRQRFIQKAVLFSERQVYSRCNYIVVEDANAKWNDTLTSLEHILLNNRIIIYTYSRSRLRDVYTCSMQEF